MGLPERLKKFFKKGCDHFFVDGFGCMGDAVTCKICGLSKYPEVVVIELERAKRKGRYISESDPDYRQHFKEASDASQRREQVQA